MVPPPNLRANIETVTDLKQKSNTKEKKVKISVDRMIVNLYLSVILLGMESVTPSSADGAGKAEKKHNEENRRTYD